jgi:hypothetical protein
MMIVFLSFIFWFGKITLCEAPFKPQAAGADDSSANRIHYMLTNSSEDWRPGGEAHWCPLVSIGGINPLH